MDTDLSAEPFVLAVQDVFRLAGRGSVVAGTIESGILGSGNEVRVLDGDELVMTASASIEFICRSPIVPGEAALLLGHVDHEKLRPGQTVRR